MMSISNLLDHLPDAGRDLLDSDHLGGWLFCCLVVRLKTKSKERRGVVNVRKANWG